MAIPDDLDYRLFAPWPACVVGVEDPMGLHRVKLRVPGLIEETDWALPITAGGGSPQFGGHIVPPVGSTCMVQFLGGIETRPVYFPFSWGVRFDDGESEMPQSIKDAGTDAHLVHALQVGDLLFTIDQRPRDTQTGLGNQFTIKDLKADKVILTYDLENQGWEMAADFAIIFRSGGIIDMKALQISANGRSQRRGTPRQW